MPYSSRMNAEAEGPSRSSVSSAVFDIVLDQEFFYTGQAISGIVKLLLGSDVEHNEVYLTFIGSEKVAFEDIRVKKTPKRGNLKQFEDHYYPEKSNAKRSLYKEHVKLYSASKGIQKGIYQFRFKLHLPYDLPSSFEESSPWKCSKNPLRIKLDQESSEYKCIINYRVKATFALSSDEQNKSSTSMYVRITNPPSEIAAPLCYETIHNIFSFLCIPRGQILVKAFLDKHTFQSGDSIQLRMEISNNSAVSIGQIYIAMDRTLTLKAFSDGGYGQLNCKTFQETIRVDKCPGISAFQANSVSHQLEIPPNTKSSCTSQFFICNYTLRISWDNTAESIPHIVIPITISNQSPIAQPQNPRPASPPTSPSPS